MIAIHAAAERGHTDAGWLDSHHTFSFGGWHDPRRMGFRTLRVINDDRVVPGEGFGSHPHRDMEIISYVLDGALAHRDSMGTGSVIRPGEVQRMSAGTGVVHSEHNSSSSEPVHFLQIWIVPERRGLPPSYEQRAFPIAAEPGRLHLVAAPDGREGAVTIHQDVDLHAAVLRPGDEVELPLRAGRHAFVQVARGAVTLVGERATTLRTGDGAALSDEPRLRLRATEPSEVLVFDLA